MGNFLLLLATILLLAVSFNSSCVESETRHYKFHVVKRNTTRLCASKPIIVVNGKFPGPTLYAREDDTVVVKVVNLVKDNVTIHWHGVRQLRTGWSDGPAYITQCPIQTGQSFIYNFTLTGQRGTLLYHAHINWQRATVHGAIVILPKHRVPYPFPKPDKEEIIVLGEWWKADVEDVINQALQSGLPPNVSDAHTINGHPGFAPNCSTPGYALHVESGKTYLLRIVNAAVNVELFFKIAGHNLTVVEVDASYTKPFTTDTIFIGPGQTTNALLAADQPIGKYLIAISPFMDTIVATDNQTATASLRYAATPAFPPVTLTAMPARNATPTTNAFMDALRSLNSKTYPAAVPQTVDHSLLFAIGVGVNPCATCVNGSRLVADINNVTFVMPTTALLQAHYYSISGVYTDDFPGNPATPYNYTGVPPANMQTLNGTRVYRMGFNSTVQIVLQGTSIIAPESHPTHLHGSNFFAVGKGIGNYDPVNDPKSFNLVDPVERNTLSVPTGGWSAIRFRADNPGVWFLHCHLEVHGNGALAFDVEYARWLEEHNRRINELRGAVNSHAGDGELRIIVEGIVSHYDDIFRIKGDAAKADVFHILSGMWKTPAERCFLWLGGFRSSELLKLLINQLEPLTEQQLLAINNLQQSSQQAEDALSQGMEALQQSLAETLAGSLAPSGSSGNVANYMGQMAMAMGKLGTLEGFIRQADNLRQQTLQQMHRILTTRQSARALLAISDYFSRLRALSSLWLARPRE